MPKIKRLPLHEAQKIAAGEVVDRPANVVKELIENSLDAEATSISVHIEQAGKQLIRVTDNGYGMDEEDALLCFEQHATSKITHVEELQHINTFGFRGEALASIAAVSSITLITKQALAEHGIKLTLKHGTLLNQEIAACTTGTDIAIHNLFENVPARKKFLKTNDTEWRAIVHLVHAFCLDHINVHFKLFHDGRQILNCPATDTLTQRIAQLWDPSVAQSMLPFHATASDRSFTIYGAASHHQYYRYDRSSMYIFVNKRWVKNHQLTNALVKGYQNVLPQGRYPAGCLFIDIDPAHVDINIHPRKEEVLFLHPLKVTTVIQSTIKKLLEDHLSAHLKKPVSLAPSLPDGHITKQAVSSSQSSSRTFVPFDFDHFFSTATRSLGQQSSITQKSYNFETPTYQKPIITEHSKITSDESFETSEQEKTPEQQTYLEQQETYTILGQYNKTYILVEHIDGLFIVDQHAAHERILYELFKHRFHEVATSQLLFPIIITLSEHEVSIIEQHNELFQEHGITVQRFGKNQVSVECIPVHLKNSSLDDLFKQAVSWIDELQNLDNSQLFKALHERLHAQMACKAAIKAGDILTHEKMAQLLKDLDRTQNKLTCPHGRPTGWLLSLYELEKKFKRKL